MEKIEKEVADTISHLRSWLNIHNSKAVIGISGGKRSALLVDLCVKAVGKERVVGVIMPNLIMEDIADAYEIINKYGIEHYTLPITLCTASIHNQMDSVGLKITNEMAFNLPNKIRFLVLNEVASSVNGIAISNYLDYFTEDMIRKFGDYLGIDKRILAKESSKPKEFLEGEVAYVEF